MIESPLGVILGFSAWIGVSFALNAAIRLLKYPKGYQVTSEYQSTVLEPEIPHGTPVEGSYGYISR